LKSDRVKFFIANVISFFFLAYAIWVFVGLSHDRLLCAIYRIFIATLITYAIRSGKMGLLGSFGASISCRLGRALSQFIKNTSNTHCSFSISCFLLSELFFRSVSFLFSFYFTLEVTGVSLLIKNATDIAVIAVMTMTQVNELLCCDGCCFSLCYLCIFPLQKFADPVNKILLLSIIQLRQLSTYNMLLLLRPPLCRCVWVFNLSLDFPVLQPVRH